MMFGIMHNPLSVIECVMCLFVLLNSIRAAPDESEQQFNKRANERKRFNCHAFMPSAESIETKVRRAAEVGNGFRRRSGEAFASRRPECNGSEMVSPGRCVRFVSASLPFSALFFSIFFSFSSFCPRRERESALPTGDIVSEHRAAHDITRALGVGSARHRRQMNSRPD